MTKALSFFTFAILAGIAGCSFHARSPEDYRDATAALLETKAGDVKACYDGALKANKELAGTVTVHFKVEKETGKLVDIKSDPGGPLGDCVTNSINGLALSPPDARDGDGTFSYQFTVGPAPAPAPAG
jgi:hypothetical protein